MRKPCLNWTRRYSWLLQALRFSGMLFDLRGRGAARTAKLSSRVYARRAGPSARHNVRVTGDLREEPAQPADAARRPCRLACCTERALPERWDGPMLGCCWPAKPPPGTDPRGVAPPRTHKPRPERRSQVTRRIAPRPRTFARDRQHASAATPRKVTTSADHRNEHNSGGRPPGGGRAQALRVSRPREFSFACGTTR